ncbi:cilium assembly protein DZIP1L isoform X2 [Malaya genurostris]|uniref:cilium assembly protein DZIP1L isoform X2 n=1 Tax=Malaya genurostris TaxID=325434 RepID=UPI0026F3CBDE|nr:cilium assembly protein DZIP1L isoform X2 [Malaya genurostris]
MSMAHKWNHNFPKIAREAGFTIRELSTGQCIDWRFIASIEPYAVVSEKDYEKLDEFIPHISQVSIGSVLQNRILDPAIGKYFILAQFSIQYLMFCKQFLDETITEIRNTAQDVQKENNRLEKTCRKKNEELIALHRKLQKMEEHPTQQIVYPCSKCTKNFISLELLNAHITRKHVDVRTVPSEVKSCSDRKLSETDTNLINTIKLELEVKQLKERLNAAEKNLMDQRKKEYICHSCNHEERTSDIKQYDRYRPHRERLNVGIQTNLDDLKDVNEKEVQTNRTDNVARIPTCDTSSPMQQQLLPNDYISKSSLETILNDQKQEFECWKIQERQQFNQEIENIRQNITEVLRELDQRDIMNPPALLSKPSLVIDDQNQVFDNIWKQRFHELERMYQKSQQQVRETVENIELVYEEKIKQFEMMIQQSSSSVKKVESSTNTSNQCQKIANPSENNIHVVLPEPSNSDTLVSFSEKSEEGEIVGVTESKSNNTYLEESVSDEEIRELESSNKVLLSEVLSPHAINSNNINKHQKAPVSPKKLILSIFKSRLKGIGIDSKCKLLLKEDLDAASFALAERRDANKKKNRNYFVVRNQLVAKVDQLARNKIENSMEPFSKVNSAKHPTDNEKREPFGPIVKSNTKTRSNVTRKSFIEILPNRLKFIPDQQLAFGPSSPTNPFKVKSVHDSSMLAEAPEVKLIGEDIITVQAEINTAPDTFDNSLEYERNLERLLETPVKRIQTPPKIVVAQEYKHEQAESEQNNISSLLQPRPVPKKRVFFNLESQASNGPNLVVQPLSSTVIEVHKPEEDSDWNISSFEDEK